MVQEMFWVLYGQGEGVGIYGLIDFGNEHRYQMIELPNG